jgi:hypothetical protein
VEEVFSKCSPVNYSYSVLEKIPVGLRAVKMQGVYWSDWGDAARIQSDIQRFCAVPSTPPVPSALTVREPVPVRRERNREERS